MAADPVFVETNALVYVSRPTAPAHAVARAALDRLLELLAEHPSAGKQVHDANIVATMHVHAVRRLLSFNTSDFRRFTGIIDLEPLPAV